jgi:hypothetical protein
VCTCFFSLFFLLPIQPLSRYQFELAHLT